MTVALSRVFKSKSELNNNTQRLINITKFDKHSKKGRKREEIPSKVMSLKKEKHSPKNPKCETAGKWEQRKREKKSTQRKKERKKRREDGLRPCFNLALNL